MGLNAGGWAHRKGNTWTHWWVNTSLVQCSVNKKRLSSSHAVAQGCLRGGLIPGRVHARGSSLMTFFPISMRCIGAMELLEHMNNWRLHICLYPLRQVQATAEPVVSLFSGILGLELGLRRQLPEFFVS